MAGWSIHGLRGYHKGWQKQRQPSNARCPIYRLYQPVDSIRRRLLSSAAVPDGITHEDRAGLRTSKAFYFIFFGAIGCIAPFFNIYLERQGLSGAQIGWLGSIPPLIALVANPFWGALADRRQAQTAVLALCTFVAGAVSLFFPIAQGFWPIMLLVIVLFFFRAPIPAITDSAVMAIVSRTGLSYGRQRLWGSLGFVVASFGLGRILGPDQLNAIFWLHGFLLSVVLVILAFRLPVERFAGQVNIVAGLRTLVRQRSYVGFLVAMIFMGMGSSGYIGFLGLHILALGGSASQVGLAYAATAVAEVPVMYLGARWFTGYANSTLITVGFSIFAASWLLMSLMPVAPAVIVSALLVGTGYGFFWVAVVGFANESAPDGMRATAQATVNAAQGGLGWGLGAVLAGYLWDLQGGTLVLGASAGLVILALITFRIGLRLRDAAA